MWPSRCSFSSSLSSIPVYCRWMFFSLASAVAEWTDDMLDAPLDSILSSVPCVGMFSSGAER
eukprot:163906-Amphidinium_carterae.1